MNDLPDFFTMDAEQIIIWADENKIKIDKRMGKDKLIDAILTELDGAETQETPAAPVEPEMTAKAPDVALKPAKPAKAAKSKLSDLEINDIAQLWGKNLGADFKSLAIRIDGDKLEAKLVTRHGEAMGEGKFTGPDERGVIGALEAAYKQMCGE